MHDLITIKRERERERGKRARLMDDYEARDYGGSKAARANIQSGRKEKHLFLDTQNKTKDEPLETRAR